MIRVLQRSAVRAALVALLSLAMGPGGARAETATVIDPTEGLDAPKAPAASPKKAAPADATVKRERQRAEAEQRRRARAEARAQAAEKESERLRAQEQARLAEAAARESAAKAEAAKRAAAAKSAARAAARLAAQREAAAREAAALEAVAKQVAAREAAARELAMRETAEREKAARETAAREAAAKEAAARERAAKEIAAKEVAAKEAAVREAAARIAAAREAADRLIAVRQASARETGPKMLTGVEAASRDASMLKSVPQFGTVFRDCAGCPEMVWLPQGDFVLGDASLDTGRPRVAVRYALAVGRFELSFSEWDACVSGGGCRRRPHDGGWGRGWQPVVNVSWLDAQQYVAWLSRRTNRRYRLLTEAEWEYAARAGTDARYWWGDQPGRGEANCADCGSKWDGRQAAPIGRFAPNPFGLYDMHGNVAEWVEDCYHDRLRDAPVDGRAWTSGCNASAESRVVRGGAWYGSARSMRSSFRTSAAVDHLDNGIGFRVARTD